MMTEPPQDGRYHYFARQPITVGAVPTPKENPITEICYFSQRKPVNSGTFMAWGYVSYDKPLTEREIRDYELRPALSNLDVRLTMQTQARAVGAWEERNHIPEDRRVTRRDASGAFISKEGVDQAKLEHQFELSIDFPKVSVPQRTHGKQERRRDR